ncbi:MAG: DNA primase, partial [Fusobacterium sp.]|nr:DNA primase [Fusobacterium sp.]
MYYKPEDIDKLIDELDIVEVVGEFVDLKKSGTSYKGLCPFHADSNPSFVVTPSKNICKCFVCGTGGNAITFYSKYKKISFNEAVKELSQKYKIKIKEQKVNSNMEKLEKYYEIMESSHKFFMERIFSNDGRYALNYLSDRGFNTELIKEHQLGYAPAKWSELLDYLQNQSYKLEDIFELGLIKRNEEKIYDTFRNRIIFPIYSTHGRIIAFGGRSLEKAENVPKYINSPDTPI